ncbi:MAG: hypothetical protein HVN35_08490 [Methanobacteriaceae archaeon]|nr:hypothetical protein [Methanobacteriaceae archaeon]
MGLTITKDDKASLNIDFVFSILFLLAILGGVFSIANERFETVHHTSQLSEARLISEKIAQAIEESYSGGEGHEITIKMPSQIDGSYYEVETNQSGVLVKIKGKCGYSFSYFKIISNYEMNQYKVILLPSRTYKIRNVKNNQTGHRVILYQSL